jgi:hypothetical protein
VHAGAENGACHHLLSPLRCGAKSVRFEAAVGCRTSDREAPLISRLFDLLLIWLEGGCLPIFLLLSQRLKWWVHKDSNLGPAD